MGEQPVQPAAAPPGRGRFVRGLIGAFAGAALGYWLYFVCLKRGVIVLPLPGALTGIGRDLATRHRSWALGVVCAVIALAVQGYIVHSSFVDGVSGLHGIFLAAFFAGIVFAFWFGIGKVLPANADRKE
jgi:hypothetical protein